MANLSVAEAVGRLLLAAVLGAAIGAEREIDGQEAGLRTHLMLALGAGLFGLVSVGAWDAFHDRSADTNFRVDVTRVASYVAAGIGFLGGGAILKQAGGVRGLTTAASLWVAAAAGLAAGVGLWVPAVAASAVALLSLAALKPVRTAVRRAGRRPGGHLVVRLRDERSLPAIVRALHEALPMTPARVAFGPAAGGGAYELVVDYARGEERLLAECAARLASNDAVSDVQIDPS
jgi:putative Mg2+ transporter-C (MgtC) family protein